MAKIKSRVSLLRAAQHNSRERLPPNADRERSSQNETKGGSVSDVMNCYSAQLPEKVRKNAVHAVELVMTASPDYDKVEKGWQAYIQGCQKWAHNLFGGKNVLHEAVHLDESTPHYHVLVMPLKDGKLNAKHFIGGSRDRMAELQDDFFEKVGRPCGLDRGQSRAETRARHTPHTLAGKAAALAKRENDLQSLIGMKPSDVEKLKAENKRLQAQWDNQTPDSAIQHANFVKAKGFRTYGERRLALEAQKNKQQQQQKKPGFHR